MLTELSGRLIAAQKEIEGKLTAWTQDLERLREGLATQLARLEQRQQQLITDAESRFAARDRAAASPTPRSTARAGRAPARGASSGRSRSRSTRRANELETHAAERRRALHEVADRLRNRERASPSRSTASSARASGR